MLNSSFDKLGHLYAIMYEETNNLRYVGLVTDLEFISRVYQIFVEYMLKSFKNYTIL